MMDESDKNRMDDVTRRFEKIIRENGITEQVAEVTVKDAGLQGEGFASKTELATVTFANPNVKPLNLFVKVVGQSESHTAMLDQIKAFEKEAIFLMEYVPAAERMWKAKGCKGPFDLYPKCYHGDARMIVMENIVLDKGYCLISRTERQDMNAAKFSLETLAKHHAVSYAMIQEEGGPEKFFKKFPHLDLEGFLNPQFHDLIGNMLKSAVNTGIGMLQKIPLEGREEAVEFFKSFQNESLIDRMINNTMECGENDVRVLNHGDYWNNNMLFLKEEGTGKIIGHKTIDFQVTRYCTGALDLVYYMFSSVKVDVRKAHLKELIELYLVALKKVSKELGHPIELTYEHLLFQYRKAIDFGFWFANCLVVGSGMDALKDFDINNIGVDEWAEVYEKLVQKWIDANPVHAKGIAEELVKLAAEYKKLCVK